MEFEAFPKIARLNRDIVITEKIDGTNAAIIVEPWDPAMTSEADVALALVDDGSVSQWYAVGAQSRKRLITPGDDNFGFARWVHENAVELVRLLGPGRHFGEWWGRGVQRGYGLDHKRFSVFNPTFHFGDPGTSGPDGGPSGLLHNEIDTVPVLYEGPFSQGSIEASVERLRTRGSVAAPGFTDPEGVIVYHAAARQLFKVTCKDDAAPKSASIHWGGDGI